MRFALNPEQRDLFESVQGFLSDRFPMSWVRAGYNDATDSPDLSGLWGSIAQQGWLAVLVAEALGGLGLGLLEAGLVARSLGAHAIPAPYLPTLLGSEAIRLAGSEQQQKELLSGVVEGRTRLTFAFRGAMGSSWDASAVGVSCAAGRLHGRAVNVEFAQSADVLVVAAKDGGDLLLYLVDPADDRVRIEAMPTLDRTVRYATVRFDNTPGQLLPGSGSEVFGRLLDTAAALYAQDLVGIAREALTRTVAYDTDRVQYGKPIGSFQVLKHLLADLHLAVTMAEHATLYATYAMDRADKAAARLAASVAKAKASDVARDATAAMIQLHGGIAFTWEHDAHIFFKRAKREEYAYGDATWHRERIAQLLLNPSTGALESQLSNC
jgi:alkylation response protein AidB-like acyl-CoA dehydrogenase